MAEVHRGAALELQERAARLRPVPARRPARPSRGAVRRQDHAPPAGLLSPDSGDSMKLYGFWRSLATYRVRVAMALKGVHAEEISIDLLKGKQHTDEYRAVNPQGVVPALVLDEGGPPLFQSLAILEYLEETRPPPPLPRRAADDRRHLPRLPGDRRARLLQLRYLGRAYRDARVQRMHEGEGLRRRPPAQTWPALRSWIARA